MGEERKAPENDTKLRILDAAELLFLEQGADGVSLRQATRLAGVNTAAVNYHFGSKERLLRAVLERRLDPLNVDRIRLLDACEARWPGDQLACEHVLAALFVPALRQAREAGFEGLSRIRFLGRAYSDSSALTVAFLKERYEATAQRFLEAFARTLPFLSRADLKLRLNFVLRAVAGMIAGADLHERMLAFNRTTAQTEAAAESASRVVPIEGTDADLLATLGNLMAGALMAAPRSGERRRAFAEVFALARGARPAAGASPVPASMRAGAVRENVDAAE